MWLLYFVMNKTTIVKFVKADSSSLSFHSANVNEWMKNNIKSSTNHTVSDQLMCCSCTIIETNRNGANLKNGPDTGSLFLGETRVYLLQILKTTPPPPKNCFDSEVNFFSLKKSFAFYVGLNKIYILNAKPHTLRSSLEISWTNLST